ncbi:MAG: phage tail tape measure protein, partial [Proteobacteria bacterium]|nr:phage tail tape measure protein [Pseudomonadota bacterium]
HAAGLTDDDNYYSARIAMIETEKKASVDALNAEIARYQSQKATGKDAIDIQKKIGDAETARTEAITDAAQKEQSIRIEQIANLNKLAEALRAVQLANSDALSDQVRSQNRTLAAFGMGDAARDRQAAIDQINDKYNNQARSIQQQLDDPLKQWGAAEKAEKEQELANIEETRQAALAKYQDYYAKLTAMQGDWSTGAIRSLQNYSDGVANISKDMQKTFDDAFQGMEDALVSFVTTGELSFTDMVNSIVADITRIAVKQSITGPLANALLGTFSSSSGTDVNNPSAYTAGSSGSGSSFISMVGSWLSGLLGRASGGPVSAGGIYRVNELGPELLNVAGKQYLMMGDQPGSVTPNGQVSAGGGHTIITNFTVQGAVDRRTQQQLATTVALSTQRALARNG